MALRERTEVRCLKIAQFRSKAASWITEKNSCMFEAENAQFRSEAASSILEKKQLHVQG